MSESSANVTESESNSDCRTKCSMITESEYRDDSEVNWVEEMSPPARDVLRKAAVWLQYPEDNIRKDTAMYIQNVVTDVKYAEDPKKLLQEYRDELGRSDEPHGWGIRIKIRCLDWLHWRAKGGSVWLKNLRQETPANPDRVETDEPH